MKLIDFNRNYIEIAFIDLIVILESDLYRNRHPNLESELQSTMTNRFVMANWLSLTLIIPSNLTWTHD